MEFRHTSILLEKVLEMLQCNPGGTYVDGTLGGGGHTYSILKATCPDGISIGFDKDVEALNAARERCADFPGRLLTIHGDFMQMGNLLPAQYRGKLDGILLDLGVSSYQLDNSKRGFSYMKEGKLDMRMDSEQAFSARDVVNTYSKENLTRIFKAYGEEKWSSRIADFIIKKREEAPLETTTQLVETIKAAIPASARRTGPHPATRVFQAIRIEVNGELQKLGDAIDEMIGLLKPGGRIAIITFHSLEDRIVKQRFKTAQDPCTCPPRTPICICGKESRGKVVNRKPILPGETEIEENPRARSAKLRVFARGNETEENKAMD